MSQYLSIGKVSKLKNVSIKSLRYYDRIGILKPAFVNRETNYRYYTEDQLYLLDAITLCIELGIPLRELNRYVEQDTINLQKLLYDGKILAEEKIMGIHKCLETLQETLQNLSISVSGVAKIPESRSGLLLPDGFYQRTLPSRTILTVPLEELDTPRYYGQYILKLFVTAQQMGIHAAYPSGILHEYANGTSTRQMFLTVDTAASQTIPAQTDSTASRNPAAKTNSSAAQNAFAQDEGSNIRTLPGGDYICRKISAHMAESVQKEMREVLQSDSFSIIETDTTSSQNKKDGYPFELQYLTAPAPI